MPVTFSSQFVSVSSLRLLDSSHFGDPLEAGLEHAQLTTHFPAIQGDLIQGLTVQEADPQFQSAFRTTHVSAICERNS